MTTLTTGTVPGASDRAYFVTNAAITVTVSGSVSVGGFVVTTTTGTTTINVGASQTLTLGASGIDLSSATASLTFGTNGGVTVNAAQTWDVASGRTLIFNCPVTKSSSNQLIKAGAGTVRLAAAAGSPSLDGSVLVNGGTLEGRASANAFGDTTGKATITMNAAGTTLRLNDDSGRTYPVNIAVANDCTFDLQCVTASSPGVTHTINGTLSIDAAATVNLTVGSNITSGTATMSFSGGTLNANATFNVGNGTGSTGQLTLAAALGEAGGRPAA